MTFCEWLVIALVVLYLVEGVYLRAKSYRRTGVLLSRWVVVIWLPLILRHRYRAQRRR